MFLINLFDALWPFILFGLQCLGFCIAFALLAFVLGSTVKRTPEEQSEWDKKWEENDRNAGPPWWGDPNW